MCPDAARVATVNHRVMAVTVVLVDDHAGFRALARRMLVDDGFQVIAEAVSSVEAAAAVARLRPDLVLLDMRLPDLDGFAVAEQRAELAGGTLRATAGLP